MVTTERLKKRFVEKSTNNWHDATMLFEWFDTPGEETMEIEFCIRLDLKTASTKNNVTFFKATNCFDVIVEFSPDEIEIIQKFAEEQFSYDYMEEIHNDLPNNHYSEEW